MSEELEVQEALRHPPFPLFGLPDLQPRRVSTYSHDGRVLSLVGLGHGAEDPTGPSVEVSVTGPLHGVSAAASSSTTQAEWEDKPETLALFYVVVSSDPAIDGDAVPRAEAILDKSWSPVDLNVDGSPETFQLVRQGAHWGAVRHIQPDHAIVVCASNVEPDAVCLEQVGDLEPYIGQM